MFTKILTVFLISMLPIVELRGAIPVGAGMGLPFGVSYITAVIGNILPVPFLILFATAILKWFAEQKPISPFFRKCLNILPNGMSSWLEKVTLKIQQKLSSFCNKLIAKTTEKASTLGTYELWGLFLFVAVPLPGTGAWTGSLIAALLQLKPRKAFIAISLGVMASGIIMGIISFGLLEIILRLFQ